MLVPLRSAADGSILNLGMSRFEAVEDEEAEAEAEAAVSVPLPSALARSRGGERCSDSWEEEEGE